MNRLKNIVTNILGLIFWGFAVKELTLKESDWMYISFLLIAGTILFRYKIEETKGLINNILGKNKELANTVDPDREKPDVRG